MTTGRRVGLVVAALVVGAAIGTVWLRRGPIRPPHAPNILLVTLDTTRADRLGAYGYGLGRTPHLDRLAADGVVFERAIAVAPITLPSHASMFSGQYPFTHGIRNNGGAALSETVPTLATALKAQGYRTSAFVSVRPRSPLRARTGVRSL